MTDLDLREFSRLSRRATAMTDAHAKLGAVAAATGVSVSQLEEAFAAWNVVAPRCAPAPDNEAPLRRIVFDQEAL